MKHIEVNITVNLQAIFEAFNSCFHVRKYVRERLYEIISFNHSLDDESGIRVITYGYNPYKVTTDKQESKLFDAISNYVIDKVDLPEFISKPLKEEGHLIISNRDSLEIHFNDNTITIILHLTGQY